MRAFPTASSSVCAIHEQRRAEALRSELPADVPSCAVLAGTLHVHVAFDIGGEVNLERRGNWCRPNRRVCRAGRARRRRLPIARPRYGFNCRRRDSCWLSWARPSSRSRRRCSISAPLASRCGRRFSNRPRRWYAWRGRLAEPGELVRAARTAFAPVFTNLLPAIHQPNWSDLTRGVFRLSVATRTARCRRRRNCSPKHGAWLAGLVRLEDEPLSPQEIDEALKSRISYGPRDLFVAEWSAAFLLDQDCGETLQIIEFANLQLLEFRFLDEQLDRRLGEAYRLIHPVKRSFLPFWRTHSLPLRALGELRMEANDIFERTGNVLKLVGDQYLARVYRMLAGRFHLDNWERSIERSLRTMEDVYGIVSDRADTFRAEFMEVVIIVLIALEIILALLKVG